MMMNVPVKGADSPAISTNQQHPRAQEDPEFETDSGADSSDAGSKSSGVELSKPAAEEDTMHREQYAMFERFANDILHDGGSRVVRDRGESKDSEEPKCEQVLVREEESKEEKVSIMEEEETTEERELMADTNVENIPGSGTVTRQEAERTTIKEHLTKKLAVMEKMMAVKEKGLQKVGRCLFRRKQSHAETVTRNLMNHKLVIEIETSLRMKRVVQIERRLLAIEKRKNYIVDYLRVHKRRSSSRMDVQRSSGHRYARRN